MEVSVAQPLRQGIPEQGQAREQAVLGLGPLSPADNGGVADAVDIGLVRQQVIQGGGVGKGCILAHGSVQALLLSVGAEGGSIEGNQRRAAGLGAGNALHRRMHRLRHIRIAGDKALLLFPLHIGIAGIPCETDRRVILSKDAVHPEDQVAALHEFLPAVRQGGMGLGVFRLPSIKVGQNRLCGGGIHTIQKSVMQFPTSPETGKAAFRLALFIYAQQVAGIVPQEVGEDSHCPGDGRGKLHGGGTQLGFLSHQHF